MSSITIFIQLFLLALFLSINNFAASVGMGFSRIWSQVRWKIAITFGLFDFFAPLVGLYIGSLALNIFGRIIGIIGILTIFLLGSYLIYTGWGKHANEKLRHRKGDLHNFAEKAVNSTWIIIVIALGVSLDNLLVGFGLGALQIPIIAAAIVFGIVTFLMTFFGVFIGNKIRTKTEERLVNLAGKGRIVTGIVFVVIAFWKFFEIL